MNENIVEQIKTLKKRVDELKSTDKNLHVQKRVLYSEIELTKMEIEDFLSMNTAVDNCSRIENIDRIISELNALACSLELGYVKRDRHFYDIIDDIFRLIGVWMCLVTSAIIFALPMIILKNIDSLLVRMKVLSPYYQITGMTKRMIAHAILCVSGIDLSTEGLDLGKFGRQSTLAFFSHSSTMDAFIIAATIPVRHFTLAKQDLFLIPFFSWLLVAFDGVPIDRHNRNTAVGSLNEAVQAIHEGDCIAIAPEGTRSKSGQLLQFKKGPFYLWEEMRAPIVPMVIYGAFDLFPPGNHHDVHVHVRCGMRL